MQLYILAAAVAIAFGLVSAPAASAVELVTNGSFELPDIPPGTFTISNAVPGWTLGSGSLGSGIEIQDHIAGSPFVGDQFAELDSDAVTAIFQDLATTPGDSYLLSFAFSPRPDVPENIMRIFWDGVLVDTLSESGVGNPDTVWTVHSYNLTAVDSSTRLTFDDLTEVSDSLGSYLDAVSVTTVPEPGTFALLGLGLLPLGRFLTKKRR